MSKFCLAKQGFESKFVYNLKGLYYRTFRKNNLEKLLSKLLLEYDDKIDDIKQRLDYYCDFKELPKTYNNTYYKDSGSVYWFDFYKYFRYFDKSLKYNLEFGDVNYEAKEPSFAKSRPVKIEKSNNILLKLEARRHFRFLSKDFLSSVPRYEDKLDKVFFRGGCYQIHRREFMRKHFGKTFLNAAHIGHKNSLKDKELKSWATNKKASLKEHLNYKLILSLEGNDVASNLKWLMSSNSLAIMPKPKFETWFMEGKLKENFHYLLIKDDHSDFEERVSFILENTELAKEIIANANLYCEKFKDEKLETLLNLLVLRKFFYLSGQIDVSNKERILFEA